MLTYRPPRFLFRRHVVLRELRHGENFLEIGAGNLMLSADVSKYYKKGTAIDFASGVKAYYSLLPESVKGKLKIIIGDLFKLDIKQKFDTVISCEVMEHVENDKQFLSKAESFVKPGGQIIISVPARQKFWTVHDEVVGHYRRYEKKQLHSMFPKSKYKDVKVISYGYPFINFFWVLRKLHGIQQSKTKSNWNMEKQTKESGIGQLPSFTNFLGIICNKYVFYIPNLISELFQNKDWSEGYIVVATKK